MILKKQPLEIGNELFSIVIENEKKLLSPVPVQRISTPMKIYSCVYLIKTSKFRTTRKKTVNLFVDISMLGI